MDLNTYVITILGCTAPTPSVCDGTDLNKLGGAVRSVLVNIDLSRASAALFVHIVG